MSAPKWRSVLFAPANQPELVAKLPRSSPDVAVLDLEDAVPAPNKAEARAAATSAIATMRALGGRPLVAVRVNAVRTPWFIDDMARPFLEYNDPQPLELAGHEYFAFNNWETDTWFDNLVITPL